MDKIIKPDTKIKEKKIFDRTKIIWMKLKERKLVVIDGGEKIERSYYVRRDKDVR